MRSLLLGLLLATTALAASPGQNAVGRETDNVAAFARLYGVARYFYPGDLAARIDWDAFAVHGVRRVREAADRRALQGTLEALFAPLGPGIHIAERLTPAPPQGQPDKSLVAWRYFGAAVARPSGPYQAKRTNRPVAATDTTPAITMELFDAVPVTGAHVDLDLGSGLTARVPLALSEGDAAATAGPAFQPLESALQQIRPAAADADLDTRLAGVVVAWNVFRHFYPYWTEAAVDWDGRLRPHLELARLAATRSAYRNALRALVADVRDGHGNVVEPTPTRRATLPVRFGLVENQVVVTATSDPKAVPVGTSVSTMAGVPAMKRLADAMALASGTTQWKQYRALQEITGCDSSGSSMELSLDAATAARSVTLPCETAAGPSERRPEPITELSPGTWYVDLTRASNAQLQPALEKLSKAAGIVFDVRGYPTDAGARLLPHLIDAPESDRWMHIAQITGPFGQIAGWQSVGWNVKPAEPRITGTVVFMTDGRAISYAESVMGYVKDRKLGTVVGSTTAGANGNVIRFPVPGGLTAGFTGMRVTGHDGRTPFHLVGVQPDVPVTPTLKGLREGRDEVLEHALSLARRR